MKIRLEEHHVMVGEQEGFYLDHFSPPNGKAKTLALHIHSAIKDTELEQKLAVIGSACIPVMTGHTNGLITALERLLTRQLQWVICLLHCMELPLCHVFTALDDCCMELPAPLQVQIVLVDQLEKKVGKPVSTWPIEEFQSIPNQHFPILTNETIHDLSTDQY